MSNKIDLDLFRLMLLSDTFEDISDELSKFDSQKCFFYYDESNNIRKLWSDENDFNAPTDSDFVLGGVMHFGESCNADVKGLKEKLKLQKSANEMKFKHISKGKDFLECLSEDKVAIFLQWLIESDLYVHFSNINNLYFAIVDIVDTIDEPAYIPFVFQMKNELYKIAKKNYRDFYKLLSSCDFPNVVGEKITEFYNGIINFVESSSYELPFEREFLRQGLKVARKQAELVFLQGNPDKTILDNYSSFYMRPLGVFPYATHIFDNKYKVEEVFSKYDFFNGDNKNDSFYFVNSKDNQLVQVSDCAVGLIGKYYTYINSIDANGAYQMLKSITPKQKSTLQLFAKLIFKSENMSKLLLHSTESIEEHDVSSFIINAAL
jgi:hypothetical protein